MVQHEPGIDALLPRACSGDDAALEQALMLATPRVRFHVKQEIQPRWRPYLSVDDILQETYIDACRSIACFAPKGENAFLRWLKRIASNNITDAIRSISITSPIDGERTPRYLTGLGPHLVLIGNAGANLPNSTAARYFVEADAASILARYVSALLEHEQFVIGQLFYEDRSAAQIGADLGRTIGAVYLIRDRALRKLRKMFAYDAANPRGAA